MFVVIEGLDGSGKSTVSQMLAKSLKAKLYKTPPEEYEPIRAYVDSSSNRYAEMYYYLSSVFYASVQIKQMIDEGESVICDRYYHTTLAAYADLLESACVDLWNNLDQFLNGILQPDLVFFLDVTLEEERERRLLGRGNMSQNDRRSIEDTECRSRMISTYEKFDLIKIDTSYLSEQDVVEKIRNYILTHRSQPLD